MIPLLLGFLVSPLSQQDEIMAPLPPNGTNAAFQQGVKAVSQFLEEGKFDEAINRAKNLPDTTIRVQVDFEGVDTETQLLFNKAIQKSFEEWSKAIPDLKFSLAPNPQIKIQVVDELPAGPEGKKTLVLFPSPDPSEPALEAVLAIKRLDTKVRIDQSYMVAETNFIIGKYLGLEQVPMPGSVMFRIDGFGPRLELVDFPAKQLAGKTLEQAKQLREYARTKQRVISAFPEIFLGQKDIDFGTVQQGENQEFQLEIVNRGKAPLSYVIHPDCSCFVLDYKRIIEPGQTGVVTIYMSTKEFQGHQDKGLFLYTNDSESPVTRISVHGMIRPAYRLKTDKEPGATYVMTPSGLKLNYYLYADDQLPFEPRKVTISGVSGVSSIEPWEGEITDPEWFEGTQRKKGYKIELLLSPSTAIGRNLVSLQIQTDSEMFPRIGANFFVQKGVAVNPASIFLGDIEGKVGRGSVILTGVSDSFKIESATTTDKRLEPLIEKLGSDKYRLTVTLNAGDTKGTIIASIVVKTNDPDSPELIVPVQAYVR